jgi:gamma-glutamyltranspeptidase
MAIALTVVEPTSNGIGSDAFALYGTETARFKRFRQKPQQLTKELLPGWSKYRCSAG